MAYLVKLMPRARRDLRLVFDYIQAGESPAAFPWYQGLEQEILSREETPNRCPGAAENGNLRHLLYGRNPHVYRMIYRVWEEKKQVDALHIRYGARCGFRRADVRKRGPDFGKPGLITLWFDVRGLDPRSIFGSANVQSCP
jgi:toxin ParE1/3/4